MSKTTSKIPTGAIILRVSALVVGVNILLGVAIYLRAAIAGQSEVASFRGLSVSLEPSNSLDLGDIPVHRETTFSTGLLNAGVESVAVTHISVSCGCTDVKVEPKVISPGETAVLSGVISSRSQAGRFEVKATLSLLGEESRLAGQVECRVSADVVAQMEVVPTEITLRPDVYSGAADTVYLKVANRTTKPLKVSYGAGHPVGLSVHPASLILGAGMSSQMAVTAMPVDSNGGAAVIRISAGENEMHLVSVIIRPEVGVTFSKKVLSLGVLHREHGNLVSDRPAIVTLSGPLVEFGEIHVDTTSSLIGHEVVRKSQQLAEVHFRLNDGWDEPNLREWVTLRVHSIDKNLSCEERILVVGVLKEEETVSSGS